MACSRAQAKVLSCRSLWVTSLFPPLSWELLDSRVPPFASGPPALDPKRPRGWIQSEWMGGWWMGPPFSEAALGVSFIHFSDFLHLVEQEKRNGSALAPP